MFNGKRVIKKVGRLKKPIIILCAFALFILPIANILSAHPALASKDPSRFSNLKENEQYKFFMYASAMAKCFTLLLAVHTDVDDQMLSDNVVFSTWGDDISVYAYIGTYPEVKGFNKGGIKCNSTEFQQEAFNTFGISPNELLCYMGYSKNGLKGNNDSNAKHEECVALGLTNDFTYSGMPKNGKENFLNALKTLTGYDHTKAEEDAYIKYRKYSDWIKGCVDGEATSKSDNTWKVSVVNIAAKKVDRIYKPKGKTEYMYDGGYNKYNTPDFHSCKSIESELAIAAKKYLIILKINAVDTACAGLADEKLKACKDGASHKSDTAYCGKTYDGDEEKINACKQGQSAEIETPSEGDDGEEEGKNSCGVNGIGWLVCPLMSFAGSLGDASYSAISYFLSIDKGIFKDQSNGGLEQAWKFFRDIANAVFAVIFLWVIFSQISNVGVSNYGIKKILPRLIIGALLVNLSFYLCQLAVDLSNILGFSLKGVLEGAASGISTQSAEVGTFNNLIVGGLAIVGIGLFIFLAVSIPTIMALLLALLVVLVILIVRQAAIILLIAVSPLAFAAWLLPNTENLFKKWVSMFRGLLIVFPVISLLYGAGKLAGAVLAAVGTNDPNNPKETMQVAALAASILPLGATPFVLKSSLNSLGSFAGKLGGLSGLANKKLGGAIGNSIGNSRLNDLKKGWQKNSAKRQANRRSGNTWLGRKADALRGSNSRLAKGAGIMLNPRRALDNSWLGRATGLSEGAARSQAISDELFENEVKGQALALRGMTSSEIATIASTGKTSAGKKVSRSMYAATIDHTMSNGGFEDRAKVLSSLAGKDAVIKNRAIKAAFAKGDNNILGNGFGDDILQDKVGNITDLKNMAINNAADGNLQAEHLVQNAAGTEWLVKASIDAATDGTNGNAAAAVLNIKGTASTARSNPNTAKNINGKLDSTFRKVGA